MGACSGIGQAPSTDGVSLRTSNRNFKGRGGHQNTDLYISSPEVVAVSAITGHITDPCEFMNLDRLAAIHKSLSEVGGTINSDDHKFGLSAAQK